MDRQRYQPVVVTMHPGQADYWEDHLKAINVPLFSVPRRRNKIARALQIAKLLRDHHPQLIHGWHMFASVYAGLTAVLLRSRASLGSLRSSFAAYSDNPVQGFLAYHLLDALVVNSEAAARELASHRPRQRLFVVPNAVEDIAEPRPRARAFLSERYGIPHSRVWVGSVGRFEPSKRFETLVEIGANLAGSGHNVQVVLIGTGRAEGALRAKVASLGIEARVTFTGELPEARRWLSAFDVFCFPSMSEGMPNAVLEAAVASLPVVGWRLPFMEEVLEDGVSGRLVPTDDTGVMEKAVRHLASQVDERLRMGIQARRRVLERCGLPAFCKRMTAVYDELLGDASGAGTLTSSANAVTGHA
jgi:glycosyltransferase involved in cell wall biosynthesis